MKLVLDNNSLFSIMNPNSVSAYLFLSIKAEFFAPELIKSELFSIMNPNSVSAYLFLSIKAEFFAPELIKSELDKYKELCVSKSGLSKHEFEIRQAEIEVDIEFSEESEYDEFLDKAIKNLPDPKDAPYLALALLRNASIWSNDPHLKEQSLVKVYTTKELVEALLEEEL